MKNIIVILITLLSVQQAFTQSFMDQMKKEKEQSSTPTQPNTTSNTNYQSRSAQFNSQQSRTTETTNSNYYEIKNRWKNSYIQSQYGKVIDGSKNNFAQWELITIGGNNNNTFTPSVFALKNKVNGSYLIEENGYLSIRNLSSPNSLHAQWQSVKVPGTNFVQIKNRATSQYINNENGSLTISALGKPGWHSAQWQLMPMNIHPTSGAFSNTATKTATNDFYPNATTMYFRYTDQVQGGKSLNLKVGDKVRVLPNQTVPSSFLEKKLDVYNGKTYYGKTGISFDPDNPKICGQTFTVSSVSPLKFKEIFPENMRNGFNSSFAFKVIKL